MKLLLDVEGTYAHYTLYIRKTIRNSIHSFNLANVSRWVNFHDEKYSYTELDIDDKI